MLYYEEQPLDLSTKSNNNVTQPKIANKNFDMAEFYRTYYAISVRSWNIYQTQNPYSFFAFQEQAAQTTQSVKRKLSDEFDEIASKNRADQGGCISAGKKRWDAGDSQGVVPWSEKGI